MRNLYFALGLFQLFLTIACTADHDETAKIESDDIQFQFEIIDSLVVNYPRVSFLCDISPNRKHILLFNNRDSEFLITNRSGKILYQFSKPEDGIDSSGSFVDRPIFANDTSIIAYSQNGISAYDFKGENLWRIERDKPLRFWFSKSHGRSMYVLDPPNYFTLLNYDALSITSVGDSLSDYRYALKVGNIKTMTTDPIVPLRSFSRFSNNKGFRPSDILPSNHVRDNRMVLNYAKENLIYFYQWGNRSFHLLDTFALNLEPALLDKALESKSSMSHNRHTIGSEMRSAVVRGVWIVDKDKVLVQYNTNDHESVEPESTLEKTSDNTIVLAIPGRMTADKYQIYKNMEKYGRPFTIDKDFSSLLYMEDDFAWFKKSNEELGAKGVYNVFYKTEIKQQE